MKFFRPTYRFASQKYFQNNKYLNLDLYCSNKFCSLTNIGQVFAKLGINMTFAKTQANNSQEKDMKHVFSVSISKTE